MNINSTNGGAIVLGDVRGYLVTFVPLFSPLRELLTNPCPPGPTNTHATINLLSPLPMNGLDLIASLQ